MKKLALMLAFACAPAAWAQYGEFWFNAGESIYKNNGLGSFQVLGGSPDDIRLEDGFRFSLRVVFNGDSLFGHEIGYAYSRAQLAVTTPDLTTPAPVTITTKQGMAAHMYTYNFLVYANHEGNRFRPFGTGGVYMANFVPPGSSAYSGGGESKFGVSYGGGLKVRVAGPWAVRFDFRQYTNPKPFQSSRFGITNPANGWLRINELSAGFGIVF